MKEIIYISNSFNHIYKDNTWSNFSSFIEFDKLNYIPQCDIVVGIKEITFTIPPKLILPETIFAVRSNISNWPIVRNDIYDQILCLFSENQSDVNKEGDTITIFFKNPSFFSTTIENLSKATFSIFNLFTNEELKLQDCAIDRHPPTILGVVIKQKKIMCEKEPFSILLESKSLASSITYPSNTDMSFRVKLPKRFEFNRRWIVALKSLHLTSKIWNIPNSLDFWFKIEWYVYSLGRGEVEITEGPPLEHTFYIPEGYYGSEVSFMSWMNDFMRDNDVCLELSRSTIPNHHQNFAFQYTQPSKKIREEIYGRILGIDDYPMDENGDGDNQDDMFLHCTLELSPLLACFLGFKKFEIEDGGNSKLIDFSNRNNVAVMRTAEHPPNIWLKFPRQICIQTNIVEHMLVGNKLMRNIRSVSTNKPRSGDIMSFTFLQNNFSEVKTTSFDCIEIVISDIDGNVLKSDDDIETVIQLMFVNI